VWRHIAQSLQGPSHVKDGTPCQDSHRVRIHGEGLKSTLVACVGDGAGSAKHSAIGSAIACDTILDHATRFLEAHSLADLKLDDVLLWCDDFRSRIKLEAEQAESTPRDFATTLCAAIINSDVAVFFQIGDGAIIIGNGSIYGIVFWPQSGEYANATNFLTGDDYQQKLEFVSTTCRFNKLAVMTDGLERLALKFDVQVPHTPFFDPLFRALASTSDLPGLNDGLRSFLGSDSIHNRTDDDKTLVLATRSADGSA
jgi:hypothetical protein